MLIPYVNYHRPCFFPEIITDKKGKQKKKYCPKKMMTPYEKLKSLDEVSKYLKTGVTIEQLDKVEKNMTDSEAADKLLAARRELFKDIIEPNKLTA